MEGFREGYDFFQSHAGNFVGVSEGLRYVNSVENEIRELVKNLNQFSSNKADVMLQNFGMLAHLISTLQLKVLIIE